MGANSTVGAPFLRVFCEEPTLRRDLRVRPCLFICQRRRHPHPEISEILQNRFSSLDGLHISKMAATLVQVPYPPTHLGAGILLNPNFHALPCGGADVV